MSNHLLVQLQRQHILLSYFKTLSVGPVWGPNPRPPAQQTGALPTELTRRRFLRKTNIMAQGTDYLPNIAIGVGTTWKAWILSPILNLQFPTRSPLPQRLKQDRLGQVKRMH